MSKSLKQVVGVVAAIAIPFAAPAIAGSIGLSGAVSSALGASAATGGAIAGSLTGAALGAGTAALTGQDVGRGALFGALGGGVGGYADPGATISGLFGRGATAAPVASTPAVGQYSPVTETASGIGGFGPTGEAAVTGAYSPVVGASASPTLLSRVTAPAAAEPGMLARLGDTLGVTPETLRRGGLQLATGALAGSGMPPGYEAALAEQRRARQMNERYAAERFAAGERLMNQARYYDPEYMGLQSARDAQLRAARATQAGLTGLTGGRREAERRRGLLETARQTGTAYDVGFGTGARTQAQLTAAGAGLIPTSYPTTMGDYASLANAYGDAEERRRRQQTDIGKFFGGLTDEEKKTGDEEMAG